MERTRTNPARRPGGPSRLDTLMTVLAALLLGAVSLGAPAATTVYYVHTDHLGTPKAMTDQSAQVVWRADHTPFGTALETVTAAENRVRFPGQYFDAETGLHYNYFRDYDPGLGRYIESDPIGLGGGLNTYAFVGGNPINRIDPTGEASPALTACFGGPVGCAIGIGLTAATIYYGSKAVTETAGIIDLDKKRKEREGEQCPPIDPDAPDECELIRNSLILEEIKIREDARGACGWLPQSARSWRTRPAS